MKHQKGFFNFAMIKMYIYGGIAIAIFTAAAYAYLAYTELEVKAAQLERNNATLKANVETLTAANKANEEVIKKLTADKKQADALLGDLRKQRLKNMEEMNKLRYDILNRVKVDPSLDGPIAPILRETILKLQKKPETKEGSKK